MPKSLAAVLDREWFGAVAIAALALAATTSVLALGLARMELPDELAAAERLRAAGYGGKNRGHYSVGDYRGDFTRIESRFAVLDPLYAASRGKSSFTLEGPGLEPSISADCRFKERVVTVGVLTFDAAKLAYVCEIAAAGGSLGSLTLGEPKASGFKERLLARARRQGVADVASVRIEIESLHRYEGSRLSSQTPVGYLLSFDSRPVGALELTDSEPTFVLQRGLTPELRHAALIAALGLSVLRDPADSMLGE